MPLPPPAGPPLRGRATSPCLGYPAPPQPQLPPTSSARLRAAPEVAGEAEEPQAGGDGARRAPTQVAGRFLSQSQTISSPYLEKPPQHQVVPWARTYCYCQRLWGTNLPRVNFTVQNLTRTHNRTTTEKPKKMEDSPKSVFMEPSSGGVPRMLPTGAVPVFAEVSIGFYLQHILFSSSPCKAGASPLSKSFFSPLPKDICSEG